MASILRLSIVLAAIFVSTDAYNPPRFFLGRPREGFLRPPDLTLTQLVQLRDDPPSSLWFEQKIDHFTPADTRTFKQKYIKAGPNSSDTLFVMIGGEGPASERWMNSGMWTEYAKKHKAVRLQLEHRYYGDSRPTENLSVENLRYLSSEQALWDTANFVSAKKKEFGASKVIVVGGSYSGSLAAWFRLKYPYLADGALATSSPLLAQVDFKGYLEVVSESLSSFSPANSCNDAISAAVKAMKEKLKTAEGRKDLKEAFNLCEDIDISVKNDISNLFADLADNFMQIVQYNNISSEGLNIDRVCKIMTNKSLGSEMARYAKVQEIMSKGECLSFNYNGMIEYYKNENWTDDSGRQWTYQTCTEFGYSISTDSDAQPFGHEFPIEFASRRCGDIFGPQFSERFISGAVNATNVNYGARDYTEDRVVFVNGNIDPWHYLGVTDKLPRANVIYIHGTAHCADMYTPKPRDPPELDRARKVVAGLVDQWLQ